MARRLTIALTSLVLSCHTLTAILLNRLPEDPLHLSTHLVYYSYFACCLSVLGFIGARRGDATLVTIFSNYLIIDVFISAATRLVTLSFLPDLRASICSKDSVAALLQSQQRSVPADDPGHDATSLNSHDTEDAIQIQCKRVVSVLMVFATLATLAVTAVQILLAIRVSTYARILQHAEATEDFDGSSIAGEFSDDEESCPTKVPFVELSTGDSESSWVNNEGEKA